MLLRQGHEGGRQAAQQLTRAVADYLTSEDVHVLGRLSFWVTIYFNKAVLASVLERHKLCSPEQLDAFIMGFSQSSPRFILVDVGYGKDATFTKITGRYMMINNVHRSPSFRVSANIPSLPSNSANFLCWQVLSMFNAVHRN
jgi:hypothetical protein